MIKKLIAIFSRKCPHLKECRYAQEGFICQSDRGFGCGVARDWELRKDALKPVEIKVKGER